MNTSRLFPAVLMALSTFAASMQGEIIPFDLQGKAGAGLVPGNQNGAVVGTPGSGGELGSGIFFNDITNLLSINIGWGSGNGFTNLTGNAFAGHIHGPTASAGAAAFTEDARFGLDWMTFQGGTPARPQADSMEV